MTFTIVCKALNSYPQNMLSEYVFCNSDGTKWKDRRGSLDGILKKAGLDNHGINFYTFRHTFCSQLVMSGVDLRTVQKLSGHKDISTTLRYAHLAPDHLKMAVSKLEETYLRR